MAFFKTISNEEYKKGIKFIPHKYGEVYKELNNMKVGECARKEFDGEKEARATIYSIRRTLERNNDDRFEITRRGKCIYICKVK